MKKTLLTIAFGAVVATLSSCGGSKQVADNYYNNPGNNQYQQRPIQQQQDNSQSGDDFDEVPNTPAEEYAALSPATRAASSFQSGREFLAAQGAATNARAELSNKLTAAIVAASEIFGIDFSKYAGTDEEGQNVTDTETKATVFVSSISKNVLNGSAVVKQNKYFNKKNKLYKVYACVEYGGTVSEMVDQAVKQLKQKVSDEDRVKIEYRQEEFEKKIEQRMNQAGM